MQAQELQEIAGRALILYDGLCGFCDGTVQWLLARDEYDRFRFAAQQSAFAESVLAGQGIDKEAMMRSNTMYLIRDLGSSRERLFARSDAAVMALLILGGKWRLWGRLLQIIPRFVRNAGYALVARFRLRIAGRFESCRVPAPSQRMKFLN